MVTRKLCSPHITLCLLLGLLLTSLSMAQNSPEYVEGVVVVQFESPIAVPTGAKKTGLQEFDRVANQYEVHQIERVYPFLDHVQSTPETGQNLMQLRRTYYVRYQDTTTPEAVASDLAKVLGVAYAEPVTIAHKLALGTAERVDPNDPKFQEQTQMRHLRLPEVWDEIKGSDGMPPVVIAIVDAGGEWRHEDLQANVWTNPGEIPGNGLDDDDNGYIDDVHGINPGNGDDTNNDPTALIAGLDESDHGTAVAGVVGAVTDNGIGIAGVAWNADIMHINGDGGDSDVDHRYEGVLYAAANGADIINTSWGDIINLQNEDGRLINQTLNLATDMGALVVAAGGNDGLDHIRYSIYPAGHPRVLSVGATEKGTRAVAPFSNYGELIDVFAPGVSLTTTVPGNNYGYWSGTSFASPTVAGIAALVKTKFPEMAPDALREQIRLSSENIDAENPLLPEHPKGGFVNALAAIQEPTLPAVRLKHWNWTDEDGDGMIMPGDAVTITATVVNYLADANQLQVELVKADSYPFIDLVDGKATVGVLTSGDSTEVSFEFNIARDAPLNQSIRFYMQVHEGAHQDRADILRLGINRSLQTIYQSLSSLYTATGGDHWTNNTNWDLTRLPSQAEFEAWYGLSFRDGWLESIELSNNNLTGILPVELGNIPQLVRLVFGGNLLNGPIPPELSRLSQLTELSLYDNSFSGSIPPEIGKLSRLQRLDLSSNSFSGSIPPEIGKLSQLQDLNLPRNSFSGSIPSEIGDLSRLSYLDLSGNSLSGSVPSQIGSLTQLEGLSLNDNMLTGALPRSLMQLDNLEFIVFYGQDLCAPQDDEFQAWLQSLEYVDGPTCEGLQFLGEIENQTFTVGEIVTDLTLPEAFGGSPPYTYTLEPTLPTGLTFNSNTRTISGTPIEATASLLSYTYTATDAGMSTYSLNFHIEVNSPVATEWEAVPESFAVYSNYPNPFQRTTRLLFDLPWPAQVVVEVMDVTGRRMFQVPTVFLTAGREKSVDLNGESLPSGLYLYRMIVTSPESTVTHVGSLVRVR
ncbi:MAG: S8 family serine peptidase [Rhodothermaceae bacterium]|nr:S8 family serine peptidase [Rhodothermaceae bacterium]MYG69883.1 S8 family serine peptidase [Rhodothermaceae bacterium]MYJ45198.1 S8 family serine peptidase [Rhodothermaceae bacterium]